MQTKLEAIAEQLIDEAKKAGATAADAVTGESRSLSIGIRNGKVEDAGTAERNAFTLRVFVGDRVAAISGNDEEEIPELVSRAVAMAKLAPPDQFAALADPQHLAVNWPDLDLYDDTELSSRELEEAAREYEESALGVAGVSRSSGAGASASHATTFLATSNGFSGGLNSSRFGGSVSVIAEEENRMERDYAFNSARHVEDLRSPAEVGLEAGTRAVRRLAPRPVASQSIPVIFDRRMSSTLVGHLAGAINGESIVRGTSFLKEMMGERIFSADTNITDDPLVMRGMGSRPFDAEGVSGADLSLVENGVLKHWLLDSASAKQLGLQTNGRAQRSGSSTQPGTSNLTWRAGTQSVDELMKQAGTGFLLMELIGQGVSLVTGNYSRGAAGFWFENGEVVHPVTEVTVAGHLSDMFASAIAADDLEFRNATNAPSLLVEGMTIASA